MPTFGILTGGGSTFPTTNDRSILSKFTAPGSGTVTQINQRWHSSSTGTDSFKGLIYAADGAGGIPGTRLGIGAIASVPAGGGDIASGGLSVAITGGVDYWIGSVIDAFSAVWECDAAGAGLSRMEGCTYGSPAATWTESGTGSATVNVYATYTAGTPPPRVGLAFKTPSQLYGISSPFKFEKNKNVADIFVADFFDTPVSGGGTIYTLAVSGGIAFTGNASVLRNRRFQVSGGVAFSGTAPNARTRTAQVSGGIAFASAAALLRTRTLQVSGGAVFSGTAPIIFTPFSGPNLYTITPSGGILLAGSAALIRNRRAQVSGGVLYAGSAAVFRVRAIAATGGLGFAGTSPFNKTRISQAGGTVTFGGSAAITFTPAGTISGAAPNSMALVGVGV